MYHTCGQHFRQGDLVILRNTEAVLVADKTRNHVLFFVLTIWTRTKFYWSVPLSAPLQHEKRRGNEQNERRRWKSSPLLFLPLFNEATQSSRCQIKIMTNFISGQPNLNHAVSSVRANSTAFLAILQLSSFTRVSQELESSQLYRFQCQFVALRANPVDDHSLLDCRGVAASGDAREHGHDAGDLAKLLEPLAAVRYRVY